MPLVSMLKLLDHAAENNYALPAFNVNNLEQIKSVVEAANEINAPVIIQASSGARKYTGDLFFKNLIKACIQSYPHIPIALHQDHASSLEICMSAIKNGFTSIMIDGTLMEDCKTVSNYKYNIKITKKIVKIAHSIGITVEGELGVLGSLENMTSYQEDNKNEIKLLTKSELLTDPLQAKDFIEKTKCDALAIAIGTSHGVYKFSSKPNKNILITKLIKKIHKVIPNTHLVIHGASSISQKTLKIIKSFGGKIKKSFGVPIKEIVKNIKYGIRKINIDTDLRLATISALRKYLYIKKSEIDPRYFFNKTKKYMKSICKNRYLSFGCEGQASKIKI